MASSGLASNEAGTAQQHSQQPPADLASCWALVTGATSGFGQVLAHSCVEAGLGVILTDRMQGPALQALAQELTISDHNARVVVMPADLGDPTEGARLLHESVRERGYDVAVLLVASDQFAYTGPFLAQPLANLDRMLALNVGSTCALCRLFGEDMQSAGRGRILLVGAPTSASPGVAGACAFAGSMAFVRALADGLRQELAPFVGVSCLESRGVGREASLQEALASTCVSFLAPAEATPVAASSIPAPEPEPETELRTELEEALPDAWIQAYTQLAREQNFQALPFGAEIDALQRSSPAEFSNALLVGFVCTIFALRSLPGISQQTTIVLEQINNLANMLFTLDYVARWWSRGLRWDYLLTPTMMTDLLSVLPFLLRGVVPALQGVELNFLKLFRVLRVYRFFRPTEIKNVVRVLLGPGLAKEAEFIMMRVRPYQLQVARTFGIVFTLLFVTAGLVYEAERGQNQQFSDFFSALYFSVIALSTVGFGDYAPVTPAGKVVISISIVVALCLIPFQASLVASAVAEEQRLTEERYTAERAETAEAILVSLEQSRAQLAWDAARIAELEVLEREERARIVELEGLEREERARIAELEEEVRVKSGDAS